MYEEMKGRQVQLDHRRERRIVFIYLGPACYSLDWDPVDEYNLIGQSIDSGVRYFEVAQNYHEFVEFDRIRVV